MDSLSQRLEDALFNYNSPENADFSGGDRRLNWGDHGIRYNQGEVEGRLDVEQLTDVLYSLSQEQIEVRGRILGVVPGKREERTQLTLRLIVDRKIYGVSCHVREKINERVVPELGSEGLERILVDEESLLRLLNFLKASDAQLQKLVGGLTPDEEERLRSLDNALSRVSHQYIDARRLLTRSICTAGAPPSEEKCLEALRNGLSAEEVGVIDRMKSPLLQLLPPITHKEYFDLVQRTSFAERIEYSFDEFSYDYVRSARKGSDSWRVAITEAVAEPDHCMEYMYASLKIFVNIARFMRKRRLHGYGIDFPRWMMLLRHYARNEGTFPHVSSLNLPTYTLLDEESLDKNVLAALNITYSSPSVKFKTIANPRWLSCVKLDHSDFSQLCIRPSVVKDVM